MATNQHAMENNEGKDEEKDIGELKLLFDNQLTNVQFRSAVKEDSFYGVILKYLETGFLDPDLTLQMKSLYKTASRNCHV